MYILYRYYVYYRIHIGCIILCIYTYMKYTILMLVAWVKDIGIVSVEAKDLGDQRLKCR